MSKYLLIIGQINLQNYAISSLIEQLNIIHNGL